LTDWSIKVGSLAAHFNCRRSFALRDEAALLMAAYPGGLLDQLPFSARRRAYTVSGWRRHSSSIRLESRWALG